MVEEKFNEVEPFLDPDDGSVVMEVETDPIHPRRVGLLWTGNTWLNIEQARELRDWLNKVIP